MPLHDLRPISKRIRWFVADYLPARPDRELIEARLAQAIFDKRKTLWPDDEPAATLEWLRVNVRDVLVEFARLHRTYEDRAGAKLVIDFRCRTDWLVSMIDDLASGAAVRSDA